MIVQYNGMWCIQYSFSSLFHSDAVPAPSYYSSSSSDSETDTEGQVSSHMSSNTQSEEAVDNQSQFSGNRGDPNYRSVRLNQRSRRNGPNIESGSEFTTVRLRARPSKSCKCMHAWLCSRNAFRVKCMHAWLCSRNAFRVIMINTQCCNEILQEIITFNCMLYCLHLGWL